MPGHRWMWGKRRKRLVPVDVPSTCTIFVPMPVTDQCVDTQDKVVLTYVELQALKLVYLDDLTQHEAAMRMGLPRSTLWRILENARKKLIDALVNRKSILIAATEDGKC